MASNNGVSSRLTRPPAGGLDPKLQALYENLEILNGARGKGMDRAVLVRDLVNLDLASVRKGAGGSVIPTKPGAGLPNGGDTEQVEPPSIPLGVRASGGFYSILVEWDKPTYSGHAYTEVYRADDDNFSNASRIATTTANLWSDQVGASKTYYYWVRFVNKLDIKGPLQSTEGVKGQTQDDIGDILDKLKGQIDETFLTPELDNRINIIELLGKTNEQGLLVIEGEVLDIKERTDTLSAEAEILAEAAMEAATGVDNEGLERRKVTAEIKLTQKVLVTDVAAQAQQILEINAKVGENGASITEVKESVVKLDADTKQAVSAITQRLDTQKSEIDGNSANITSNAQTIVQVDNKANANAQTITTVSTKLDQLTSTVDDNKASITTNQQAIVTVGNKADSNAQSIQVVSQKITTVESDLNNTKSTVTQNSQTIAEINSDGTEKYKAQWGVKTSIGDITAGIGLTVKKETGKPDISQCTVIADQFSVGNIKDGKTIYPFIVTTEGVYMDTAYIKAAKIQDLVAGEVVADNIKVGATLTAPYIKGGRIEIGSNFTVDENGNVVGNNSKFTNITANGGNFSNVIINENCTVRGRLDGADGTFTGTVYAENMKGDIYRAINVFVSAKANIRSKTLVLSGSFSSEKFSRLLQFPSLSLYGYGENAYVYFYVNGVQVKSLRYTISDNRVSVPPYTYYINSGANTPSYAHLVPANVSGTFNIYLEVSSGGEVAKLYEQNVIAALFKA